MTTDVAPTDDLGLSGGNELRIAFCNHADHELPRLRQRSRFQHRQVSFLPRDHVECVMKAIDVGGSDRFDPDIRRFRRCGSIHTLLLRRL